jgi:hypothetical protein
MGALNRDRGRRRPDAWTRKIHSQCEFLTWQETSTARNPARAGEEKPLKGHQKVHLRFGEGSNRSSRGIVIAAKQPAWCKRMAAEETFRFALVFW